MIMAYRTEEWENVFPCSNVASGMDYYKLPTKDNNISFVYLNMGNDLSLLVSRSINYGINSTIQLDQ